MKKMLLIFLFFYFNAVQAQEELSTSTGIILFEASVPIFEEVKGVNHDVICTIDLKTSEISCTVYIKKFQFKRDLMRTHFNDNYLESDRYPKATFIGRIEKFDYKSLSELPTEFQIKGIIKIHGKSKPLSSKATLKKVASGMEINTSFVLNTEDFKIEIPSIVAPKISKQVQTTLKAIVLQ